MAQRLEFLRRRGKRSKKMRVTREAVITLFLKRDKGKTQIYVGGNMHADGLSFAEEMTVERWTEISGSASTRFDIGDKVIIIRNEVNPYGNIVRGQLVSIRKQ